MTTTDKNSGDKPGYDPIAAAEKSHAALAAAIGGGFRRIRVVRVGLRDPTSGPALTSLVRRDG